MNKDEEIIELKKENALLHKQLEADINTGLIKAFNMKPGEKYLLVFGRNNGLSHRQIMMINDPHLVKTMFIVDDVERVDLLDREKIKKWLGEK